MFVIKAKDIEDFRKQLVEYILEQSASEAKRTPTMLTKVDKASCNGRAMALKNIAKFIAELHIEE